MGTYGDLLKEVKAEIVDSKKAEAKDIVKNALISLNKLQAEVETKEQGICTHRSVSGEF